MQGKREREKIAKEKMIYIQGNIQTIVSQEEKRNREPKIEENIYGIKEKSKPTDKRYIYHPGKKWKYYDPHQHILVKTMNTKENE